ncbi:MAG TPA: hypothetical protein VHI11_12900 [Jiangellaceae bacterium]|nr:hypothetical protein [Jiangellaceae bacterium]
MIQLIASFLLIAAGLYLAVLADVAEGSDMQTFGWIIVAAGILGVIANIVFSRIGQGRDQP